MLEANAASGSARISYSGSSNVTVGSNITIQVRVSDIVGKPLAGIGGKVVFDKEYLQYVSSTGATSPYAFNINLDNYKIAGLSFSGTGIANAQTIYTFVFKAVKSGTTSVRFTDIDLSDVDGNIPVGSISVI